MQHVSTGLAGICPECQADWGMEPREFFAAVAAGEIFDEGSFSKRPCDECDTGLGGNSFAAHGFDEDGSLVHFRVCVDCLERIGG